MTPEPDEFEELLRRVLAESKLILKVLIWTNNRVSLVSARTHRRAVTLRISKRLLSLGTEAVLPIVGLVRGDRDAKKRLQVLFNTLPSSHSPQRRTVLRTEGKTVNLGTHLTYPCALLNMDIADVQITWAAKRRLKRGQRTFRLGSYDPRTDVIRIHRILDHPEVPSWYIEFVVFHELIHRQMGHVHGLDAARKHNAEFRAIEATFPWINEARSWERTDLMRLARKR
jgi:hypothetical protein